MEILQQNTNSESGRGSQQVLRPLQHSTGLLLFVSTIISLVTPFILIICSEGCSSQFIFSGLYLLLFFPSYLWLGLFHPISILLFILQFLGKAILFFVSIRIQERHFSLSRMRVIVPIILIGLYIILPVTVNFYIEQKRANFKESLVSAYKEISNDYTKTQAMETLRRFGLDRYFVHYGNVDENIIGENGSRYACLTDCVYIVNDPDQLGRLGYCFFNEELVYRYGSAGITATPFSAVKLGTKALSSLPECNGDYTNSCTFTINSGETLGEAEQPCRMNRKTGN